MPSKQRLEQDVVFAAALPTCGLALLEICERADFWNLNKTIVRRETPTHIYTGEGDKELHEMLLLDSTFVT